MENTDQILDFHESVPQSPRPFAAETGVRLAHYLLDSIGVTIIFYGFMFLAMLVMGLFSDELDGPSNFETVVGTLLMLFGLGSFPAYFIVFEYFWGKTPAKFLTKTVVVTEGGKRPSFWNIVGRTLCRFIPFEPFSFLFSGGSQAQGWHDSISKTLVVRDSYRQQMEGELV
jgi:uncharacterized RDD family membrane protein YckC